MATEKKAQQGASTTAKKRPTGSARSRSSGRLHLDPEQSARFMLIGGVGLLIAIALGFIAFGYYWTEIRPEHRTVLQVDSEKVSFVAMKRRMSYELFEDVSLQQDASTLATVAYANLVKELTVVNRGPDLGATFDDAAFDKALRAKIGAADDADQRAFQDALRRQLDATGLTESEYRRLVRAEALSTAITEKFKAELPPVVPQAKIEVISAPSLEAAQGAIDRINAGEAFADVARAVSTESNVGETGGVHDYESEGGFNPVYDGYAFSASVGQLSGPLAQRGNSLTYYVVRVVDRSDQPVREDQKPTLAQNAYDEWFSNTTAEMESSGAIVNKFNETAQNDALVDVVKDATPRLIAQQQRDIEAQQAQQTAIAGLTASPATPAPATSPVGGATAPAQPPAPAP